jgi:hypothetical protein
MDGGRLPINDFDEASRALERNEGLASHSTARDLILRVSVECAKNRKNRRDDAEILAGQKPTPAKQRKTGYLGGVRSSEW